MHGRSDAREIGGDVVFKSAFANKAHQVLHSGNFYDACASERAQWVVGESSLAHIATHLARGVVSGDTSKTHGLGFDQSHTRTKRIFLADGSGDDLLEVHLYRAEKM